MGLKQEYIGKHYGRLVIVRCIGRDPKHKYHYFMECICDCGKSGVVTRLSGLQTGSTQSCGCYRKEMALAANKGHTRSRLAFGENALNLIFSRYKREAAQRGLSFELSRTEFKTLTSGDCYYCGATPSNCSSPKGGFGHYIYNGIDRVKNSLGYIRANCVPCCISCNSIKNAVTEEMVVKLYHLYEVIDKAA